MAGQALRRSQFITTYGPGAILEGKQGPRIIPNLALSGLFKERTARDFEITDTRLSSALLDNAHIVRLPSNAELAVPDAVYIYETIPFPSWALCTIHHILYKKEYESGFQTCPRCKPGLSVNEAWQKVHRQAIRFVMVCPNGHLDDVNWIGIVRHKRENCKPSYLKWSGSGSSLRNINIVCPDCGGYINLGGAYVLDLKCSGRFPENNERFETCSADAKMIQRGAANIRMSELYAALTIPPADTTLHRLLQQGAVRDIIEAMDINTKQELIDRLNRLVAKNRLGAGVVQELLQFHESDMANAISQIKSEVLPQDNRAMRLQEFEALRKAAADGAPPVPSSIKGGPPQFEVNKSDVREFSGSQGRRLRVTPISRLRVVMAQKGYRRIDPVLGKIVDIVYEDEEGRKWYPGVELYGEGIFIDLAPESLSSNKHFSLNNDQNWFSAWRNSRAYHQRLFREEELDFLHPVFVWWHTLAHRLINALSIDSGYSSAAVRERVYVDIDEETGEAFGGILLYTAQPGGDGTLGGMIALVPQFERVLRVAWNTIDACSNDPLCGEMQFGDGQYNGAACYACLLVSETSCEHRNTRLDRNLLKRNLP